MRTNAIFTLLIVLVFSCSYSVAAENKGKPIQASSRGPMAALQNENEDPWLFTCLVDKHGNQLQPGQDTHMSGTWYLPADCRRDMDRARAFLSLRTNQPSLSNAKQQTPDTVVAKKKEPAPANSLAATASPSTPSNSKVIYKNYGQMTTEEKTAWDNYQTNQRLMGDMFSNFRSDTEGPNTPSDNTASAHTPPSAESKKEPKLPAIEELKVQESERKARAVKFPPYIFPMMCLASLVLFACAAPAIIKLADYTSSVEKRKRYWKKQFTKAGLTTLGYANWVMLAAEKEYRILEEKTYTENLREEQLRREEELLARQIANWSLDKYFEQIGAKPSTIQPSPRREKPQLVNPQQDLIRDLSYHIHYELPRQAEFGIQYIDRLNGSEAMIVLRRAEKIQPLRELLQIRFPNRKIELISREETGEIIRSENFVLRVA